MSNGCSQRNVGQALTSNFRLNHLNTALLANDSSVLHALILSAQALIVLHRPKDFRAEEPVPLRLESPVVDGLRLLYLPERPLANRVGRGERDAQRVEGKGILGLFEEIIEIAQVGCLLSELGSRKASYFQQ